MRFRSFSRKRNINTLVTVTVTHTTHHTLSWLSTIMKHSSRFKIILYFYRPLLCGMRSIKIKNYFKPRWMCRYCRQSRKCVVCCVCVWYNLALHWLFSWLSQLQKKHNTDSHNMFGSVCPSVCRWALSCLNCLTFDLDFWHDCRPWLG